MRKTLLIVGGRDSVKATATIRGELNRVIPVTIANFWSIKLISLNEKPITEQSVNDIASNYLCDNGTAAAAVFYNPSSDAGLHGSQFLARVCHQFLILNPDVFVSYYYTSKHFLPDRLKRQENRRFRLFQSYNPYHVAIDTVNLIHPLTCSSLKTVLEKVKGQLCDL